MQIELALQLVTAIGSAVPEFPPLRINAGADGYSSSGNAPPPQPDMVFSDNGVVEIGADWNRGGMYVRAPLPPTIPRPPSTILVGSFNVPQRCSVSKSHANTVMMTNFTYHVE